MHVVKRIPLGGGLGGGSTDAAAVLRWAGCTDPEVALALGSDVPFSVVGGRALVEGNGREGHAACLSRRGSSCFSSPRSGSTRRMVYAAWDELAGPNQAADADERGNALTEAALAVEPRLAGGVTPCAS